MALREVLEDGIYVFGHSHVQWSHKVSRRNILLINPGSCGLPLDAVRDSIPYSILTITESGEANVWTKVIFRELLTAREHMMFFLKFVNDYAEKIGDPVRPFSVETWEAAYEAWDGDK